MSTTKHRALIKHLVDLLEEMRDYFDNKSGSIDLDIGQTPNAEAVFATRIEETLGVLDGLQLPLSVSALMDRIEEVRKIDPHMHGDPQTPLQLTCRFVAFVDAEDIREGFMVKDYLDLIIEGTPLGGPYKTEDDVARWVREREENEPWAVWDEWLDDAIYRFFGIPREEKK